MVSPRCWHQDASFGSSSRHKQYMELAAYAASHDYDLYVVHKSCSFILKSSKTYPQWSLHPLRFPRLRGTETFFTVKEGVFSTSPSLLQGELHLSHQASLSSGTRGCSWLRYSLRQSFGIVSGACALKGCR